MAASTYRTAPMILSLLIMSVALSTLLTIVDLSDYRFEGPESYFAPKFPYNGQFYVHYVRFKPDNGNMTFRFLDYLSVMSAVNNLKPDKIFVHGDAEPTGTYWKAALSSNLIEHPFRNITTKVGHRMGSKKTVAFKEHSADIAKLDALVEYGGVAVDFDVFFVRGDRIKEILKTKESMTCFGEDAGYNIGFIAGRPGAELIAAWRRSYEDIYQDNWNFNQAFVCKYLSVLFREKNYVAGFVCNNPHPHNLTPFYVNYGVMNWSNSMAIHNYYRHSIVVVDNPEDLYTGNYTNSTNHEMLVSIYEGRELPAMTVGFDDEIDPLTGKAPERMSTTTVSTPATTVAPLDSVPTTTTVMITNSSTTNDTTG